MRKISSTRLQISQIKKSLKSAKSSFERFADEANHKWRIGRRNFPWGEKMSNQMSWNEIVISSFKKISKYYDSFIMMGIPLGLGLIAGFLTNDIYKILYGGWKMPDTLCRRCGCDLITSLKCQNCFQTIKQFCPNCKLVPIKRFHVGCLLLTDGASIECKPCKEVLVAWKWGIP